MANGNDPMNLESIVENNVAKLIARYIVPGMLTVGSAAGLYIFNGIKEDGKATKEAIREVAGMQGEMQKVQSKIQENLSLLTQQVSYDRKSADGAATETKIQLQNLREELKAQGVERYRQQDAVRDLQLRDMRLDGHDRRIDTIERRP